MIHRTRKLLIILFLFILGWTHGPSITLAAEFPTLYRGIRPLGMGGAFITLSDDENALFYNPAGLNDVQGFGGIGILNPLAEISKASTDLYSDIKDLDGNDILQVTNVLNDHIGEHQHIRMAMLPHVYFHNFAVGILAQGTMDLEVRNPAFPEVVTDVKSDLGVGIGMARGIWGRALQVGASAKMIQRQGIKKTFTAVDIAGGDFDPLDDLKKETDVAFDVGAKVNLVLPLRPSMALVVQNITDLEFGTLGTIPQQINAGVAINPSIIGLLSTTWMIEVNDLTEEVGSEEDFYKRVHLGTEWRFPRILSLRAGINQGYFTAGLTLDFWLLKLVGATYTEEVGTFAGQRDDHRYVLQTSIGF
jgi:hypothetical protein